MAQVIILAIVQGLTEFLPVSSTAHLYLASWLLGWKPATLDFDISLHIGTFLAVLIYFLPDWIQLISQAFGIPVGHDVQLQHNPTLLWLLALGSIPVGLAGLAFNKQAKGPWRNPYVMGSMLVVIGIGMWFAEQAGRGIRDLGSLNLPDSIAIGISQALAIVPGTSRSGITISAGLFRDFTRESAARFSFLLSTPVIAAAALKTLYEMHSQRRLGAILQPAFLVGVVVSAATGWAVIGGFLHYLRLGTLRPFVYYRLIFGIIVLALAFIRRPA
jgi:undecaprenyl-diphosphatase